MNVWTRSQRAREIAADRAVPTDSGKPMTWGRIAKKHGITPRQAQRIYAQFLDFEAAKHGDPLAIVDDALLLREALLERLGEIVASDAQETAIVGAARAMREIDVERLELMQAVGRLPRSMTRWQSESDFAEIVRGVLSILEANSIGEPVLRQIQDLVRSRLPAQADNVRSIESAPSAR